MTSPSADLRFAGVGVAKGRGKAYDPGVTMASELQSWLDGFSLHAGLRGHVERVLGGVPEGVLRDFVGDPGFVLCDYDAHPVRTAEIPVRLSVGRAGRSVVLKRSLSRRPEAFNGWVIAHELAHAHLRNRGRTETEDPESAADALAATWGFPKPDRALWGKF